MNNALKQELEAIASDELAGPLSRWDCLTPADSLLLLWYLRDELGPLGMLSAEQIRSGNGSPLIRKQAKALLKGIAS